MRQKNLSVTQEIVAVQDELKYLMERYSRRYAGAKLSVDVVISTQLMQTFRQNPHQWWDFQSKTAKVLGVSVCSLRFCQEESAISLTLPH